MTGLTQRQADVLAAITELTVDGVGPTIEELRARLQLASKSQVHEALKALKARGRVDWIPAVARSVHVVEPPPIGRFFLEKLSVEQLIRLRADAADILHDRRANPA